MPIKTIAVVAMLLILSGCSKTPIEVTNEPMADNTAIPKVAEQKLQEPVDIQKNVKTIVQHEAVEKQPIIEPEASIANLASPQLNWQPNEAHIFRGRELILGLKDELNRQPSKNEMINLLESHMGLSKEQAICLVAEL